ncbi:MICOS complex subunit MIC27 [Cololabis saira]|uniref:MICOS complex subunit MIC27 n=1 Tax=Cololabis saira TaxID=129043 RepID=UPI002AD53666|nr:MICOS complex subunit MIC27 [Cololabis saira]
MAAKVVMVAVPTVLGIASIRVYSVTETPAEGLVPREKLNIYTPESSQTKFAPHNPGAIERRLTTTRESLIPLVQTVKGAYVSVKRGSINLYHAGEDAYYYLVDPPPDFLPRFGTITVAGLLGMFLARRGSRFKRLAVPLGLMSAGASLCYPAQAVSVLKVTGKKVYAVGQWSVAAASSLLASKPPVSSQQKSATEPKPESVPAEEASSQSPAIPDAEVLISHEPAVTVTTKEESSITLTEVSPNATPEAGTGSYANSLPEETKSSPPSEGLAAPAGSSEALDSKQAADDVPADTRPVEPTPSLEPETIEEIPAESALAKSAEVQSTPSEVTSAIEALGKLIDAAVESREPVPAAEAKSIPAAEDPTNPTLTPPPPQQPAAETRKEGSAFKPKAADMDFGQSNPEDEDLYSTRS